MRSHVKFKFLCIFIPFLSFFLMSHNTYAANLQTNSFDLYYRVNNNSSYGWRNNITYGNNSPTIIDSGGGITRYQFNTPSVQAGGNYLTLHFETNIVASAYVLIHNFNPWVNLPQQNILTCSASGIAVVSKNLSYATTYWTDQDNESNNTLTFYGDVVLSGFNPGSNYNLVCSIGSDSFSFINFNGGGVWFEQNPMSIVWSNDQSIALMNTQIEQQNTIINQNETIINNQNQNTEDIINNQNQNTQDIIKSNQRCFKNLLQFTNTNVIPSNAAQQGATTTIHDSSIHFIATNSNSTQYAYYYTQELDANSQYTISGIAKKIANTSVLRVTFSYSDNGTTWATNSTILNVSPATAGTIENFSYTFSGHKYYRFGFYNSSGSTNIGTETEYYNIMIFKGDSPSNFIPYGEEVCKNVNEEYYDEQRQADQNISNQSTSDIDGSTNQSTTNLIGVLSSFLTQLQSFQPSNCNLSLPFPQFIGGTQTVNICQGKDVLGNFITVIGTLAMVTFYIPLALVLLKMIYNEIRSFTNG